MEFKKKKLVKSNKNVLNIVGIISVGLIFIFALFLIKNINLIKIIIDEKNLLNTTSSGEVVDGDKQETGKSSGIISNLLGNNKKDESILNILLLGRDNAGYLTDTIILAKLDTKKKYLSMLSIPRDLYVAYPGTSGGAGKINSIYPTFSNGNKNIDLGINAVKEKITEITGEKVDYYVSVDFNGFIDIIDTIGGITLEIPENFVDYKYPDSNWGYRTLVFRKGIWLFSGENTLKYARSRHSTSDFDRSLRQQQVISAIKDKISGSYFLTSPGKIKELYDVLIKNLQTDIPFTKIVSLAYTLNSRDDYKIYSANLNDSCYFGSSSCSKGGFLYTPVRDLFNGMSVLLVNGTYKGNISRYDLIKTYSNIMFNYPKISEENFSINIFNSTKTTNLAGTLINDIKRYGFIIPDINSIGNTQIEYENSVIYYNNISKDSDTIKGLKKFFSGEFIEVENPLYSKTEANIEIVIGKDYILDKSLFKF